MKMPNFIIIGAAKAGTTSLYNYLKQHPQIYMSPEKEPGFFAYEGKNREHCRPDGNVVKFFSITSIEAYQAQFEGVSNETAIGEATPIYLYNSRVPERIQQYIPNAKVIAILRDPIERAFSHFSHYVRDRVEPLADFSQAIQEAEVRIRNELLSGHYIDYGFYYAHLKPYFQRFDRDQIRIYLYQDFKANPLCVVQDIFRFLNVDDTFTPDVSLKYNVSGIPRNRALHTFLTNLASPDNKSLLKLLFPEELLWRIGVNLYNWNLNKQLLEPEVRRQLIEIYREDILKLQDQLQQDLSKWLE
ncbi:sulfotransferase [Plectonema radiosum NIES-515]|uniref:Sulfotransferase n=1 Tax=Plectonema radiosum NIES-515 TaxID=2986073 RepID=A0ABT3B597_9CYAN|nr:sulfotransferase [Plectonema radiosum]MCV3216514.1 sulfotransferase [Plectonema radiosum NIES-515]